MYLFANSRARARERERSYVLPRSHFWKLPRRGRGVVWQTEKLKGLRGVRWKGVVENGLPVKPREIYPRRKRTVIYSQRPRDPNSRALSLSRSFGNFSPFGRNETAQTCLPIHYTFAVCKISRFPISNWYTCSKSRWDVTTGEVLWY